MLSLIELQRKKVEAKRKKYEKDEMDSYLELVYENYKELIEANKKLEAEKNDLNQKMKKLSDGIQYYRSIETTLQKALILAEKTSKETKDAAILKAEAIEKEANKKADEIIHSAEGEYNKIKGRCVQLVQQFNQYKLQLIEAASTQLQLVEGEEFDISNPEEFEKTLDIPVVNEKKAPEAKKAVPPVQREVKKKPAPAAPRPQAQPQPAPKVQSPVQESVSGITPKKTAPAAQKPSTEDILNADTIDLRVTLDAVKTEAVEPAKVKEEDSSIGSLSDLEFNLGNDDALASASLISEDQFELKAETQKEKVGAAKAADVKTSEDVKTPADVLTPTNVTATIIEPVQAKTVAPMDIVFQDEIAANEEKAKEVIEPKPAEKAAESIPTLDSLLQDLNINNKNNQKSDDPFEFLGSVDDF